MDKLKIFLSYSHEDKELAYQFHNYLCKYDFEIIWDENTIVIGDDLNKLKNALYEADVYLPIISGNFERSKFTQSELLAAVGYSSVRERPRLIPYIAYGSKIPYGLSSLLCIMGTSDIEYDLSKIVIQLNKIKGLIFAAQDMHNEIAEQINTSLDVYLKDVFTKLEKNERRNRVIGYISYVLSVLFLLLILPTIIFFPHTRNSSAMNTVSTILFTVKNLSVLSVLAAISRLTFILGKSFMVESIRNGDRIHAISFGKFFIQAYGNKVTRQEIREVLGDWNIDKGSSFHTQDAKEIDPNFYGTLELMKSYFDKK